MYNQLSHYRPRFTFGNWRTARIYEHRSNRSIRKRKYGYLQTTECAMMVSKCRPRHTINNPIRL